jgi:ABC-2 type transport system ATP-binding protein/lipopolysaccharide transport system ATP-binding protein
MSGAGTVLELRDVSLCYRLAKQRIPSMKEYALHWVRGALDYESLWALREVSLTVRRGESVGIVGRNGAGKSTLLKVASRVLEPTHGEVRVAGRVAPIIELGIAFDPELTGIENVYLSALLLGHRRREIAARLDEIVAFSELGDFLRAPVRSYSSGMQARLAFSILTAWPPDVLVLDEFFAVGDAAFEEKSRARIDALRRGGTTLLLVSHTLELVRESCGRCVWLESGRIRADGEPGDVLDRYAHETATS